MALGFTLPLFIVLAVQSAVGGLLLVPIKALVSALDAPGGT